MIAARDRKPERKAPVRRDWSAAIARRLRTAARVTLVFAAGAVLVGGIVQLSAHWRQPAQLPVAEPAAASYPPALGEVPVSPPVRPGDPASFTVFGLMAQEAARAPRVRDFVERAKRNPDSGGVSYAAAALTYCDQWHGLREERAKLLNAAADASAAPVSFERLPTITRATERCDGLTPAETSVKALFELYESRAAKRDRILLIQGRLQAAVGDERMIVVREILQMRDPLLLSGIGRFLGQGAAGGAPQVDGRSWGGVSEAAYVNAWSLVPCSFGAVCDDTDPEVELTCAQQGLCFADRKEMLKSRMAPRDFDDMQRLHGRLVEIVATADADALRPKQN
jgi:hypothetical protein